jgi:energy-coupling factor transporter ATP-binding protein EcfA2
MANQSSVTPHRHTTAGSAIITGVDDGVDEALLTYPRLIGVRIAECPPIDEAYIDLSPGLVVLYGRNGAGKTRVLTGIERAAVGQPAKSGSFELQYQWSPPPTVRLPRWWRRLPGNPWSTAIVHYEPAVPDGGDRDSWAKNIRTFDEISDVPLDEYDRAVASPRWNYARHLALENDFDLAKDREAVIRACVELADLGVFRLSRSSNTKLVPCGNATSETPALQRIWNEVVAELREAKRNSPELTFRDLEHDLFEIAGSFDRYGGLAFSMDSAVAAVAESPHPWWYADTYVGGTLCDIPGPCVVINEAAIDLVAETTDYIQRVLFEDNDDDVVTDRIARLLTATTDGFTVDSRIAPVLHDLSTRVSEICAGLMEDAPIVECTLNELPNWVERGVLTWNAIDPTGAQVPVEHLSRAQARWATFAIRFAVHSGRHPLPLLVVLDEPEAALHRRAERYLVEGLTNLAKNHNATIVTATHSPAFFSATEARLVHVSRGGDGSTELASMNDDIHASLVELGLEPADLLQHCRLVVLVEGEHELIIFDELFGAQLKAAGAELFALRGLRNLKTHADAQLLYRFTNARILIVTDNERSEDLNDIWDQACTARDADEDPLKPLEQFPKNSGERTFLSEFMAAAVLGDQRSRIHFHAMSLPDIIEYLPVERIAPGAPAGTTWPALHTRHAKGGGKPRFKDWLAQNMGGDYSDATLRRTVGDLDEIHPDFTQLLNHVQRLAKQRWP